MPAVRTDVREAIPSLVAEGLSGKEMAERLGCGRRTVSEACRELGIVLARKRTARTRSEDLHPDEAFVLAQMDGVPEGRSVAQHVAIRKHARRVSSSLKPRSGGRLTQYQKDERRTLPQLEAQKITSRCSKCGWSMTDRAPRAIREFAAHECGE